MSFYISLGLTTPNTTALITPSQFYEEVDDIFEVIIIVYSSSLHEEM